MRCTTRPLLRWGEENSLHHSEGFSFYFLKTGMFTRRFHDEHKGRERGSFPFFPFSFHFQHVFAVELSLSAHTEHLCKQPATEPTETTRNRPSTTSLLPTSTQC